MIGNGVLADSLAKVLGALVSERAACVQGPSIARVLAPDLVVLAGDAAHDRGAPMLARLAQDSVEPLVPVLVICAPNLGGSAPQPMPRHVGILTPEGGMIECARRVRAVLELFVEEGLAHCSMQQLADTVAARMPLAPSTTAHTRTQTRPVGMTQPALGLTAKPASAADAPVLSQAAQGTKAPATLKTQEKAWKTGVTSAFNAPVKAQVQPPNAATTKFAGSNVRPFAQPAPANAAPVLEQPAQRAPQAVLGSPERPLAEPPGMAHVIVQPIAPAAPAMASSALSAATSKKPIASAAAASRVAVQPNKQTLIGFTPSPAIAGLASVVPEIDVTAIERPTNEAKPQAAATMAKPDRSLAVARKERTSRKDSPRDVRAGAAKTEAQVAGTHGTRPAKPPEPQASIASAGAAEPKVDVSLREALQPGSSPRAPAVSPKPQIVVSPGMQPTKVPEAKETAEAAPAIELQVVVSSSEPAASLSSSEAEAINADDLVEPVIEPALDARPTYAPASQDWSASVLAAESQVVEPLSERPTTPPESHVSAMAVAGAVSSHETAHATSSAFMIGASVVAAEPEIVVSLSEPAPNVATQRDVAPASRGDGRRDAAGRGTARRIGNPLEPVRAQVQRGQGAIGKSMPALGPNAPRASITSAEPDIVVSFSEPPPGAIAHGRASKAIQAAAAAEPAPPRTRRRIGNPLDAAGSQPQPASATSHAGVTRAAGTQPIPGLQVVPYSAEASAAEVPPSYARPRSSGRRAPILYAAAAVGVGLLLLLFQLLHRKSPDESGGTAALGALRQAAAVPTPAVPASGVGVTATPPANLATPGAGSTSPTQAAVETALSNRTSPTERQRGSELAPSELSPAQVFVDEGMALSKNGRLGLAEAAYLKALKTVPGYPGAMAALVRVHIQRRDGAEAVRWAEQLAAQQSDNGANLLLLGDAQQLRGDLDAARAAWTEAASKGNATARRRLEP